ncbi:MAG: hypothetical protein K6A68_15570, partial [Clostridiales bacterium]|nr:hypothetical protein [Clostridiales bacterium]
MQGYDLPTMISICPTGGASPLKGAQGEGTAVESCAHVSGDVSERFPPAVDHFIRRSEYHKGVNVMSLLQTFIGAAKEDRPVYICDVRDAFQREGTRPFNFHAVLYDGSVRR